MLPAASVVTALVLAMVRVADTQAGVVATVLVLLAVTVSPWPTEMTAVLVCASGDAEHVPEISAVAVMAAKLVDAAIG